MRMRVSAFQFSVPTKSPLFQFSFLPLALSPLPRFFASTRPLPNLASDPPSHPSLSGIFPSKVNRQAAPCFRFSVASLTIPANFVHTAWVPYRSSLIISLPCDNCFTFKLRIGVRTLTFCSQKSTVADSSSTLDPTIKKTYGHRTSPGIVSHSQCSAVRTYALRNPSVKKLSCTSLWTG